LLFVARNARMRRCGRVSVLFLQGVARCATRNFRAAIARSHRRSPIVLLHVSIGDFLQRCTKSRDPTDFGAVGANARADKQTRASQDFQAASQQ
jgi:hypothetical protein